MRFPVAIIALLAVAAAWGEEPDRAVPAINQVAPWRQIGQQPYEMTWVARREHPETLVDFEDLTGWKLELFAGADGELRRSREQQMWGRYVAKILYSGQSEHSRVVAVPPAPIPIPKRFDSIELWGYGNRWKWAADSSTPAAEVAVYITGTDGREHRIQLATVRWKGWWLIHRKLPTGIAKQISWPATFTGLEIARGSNPDARYFFCDSLVFYTESAAPLSFARQPRRNLKPFRGQIVGTNTGEGRLPFPTREETILPENFERVYENSVRESAPGEFELRYHGGDAEIIYRYRPRTGDLGELRVAVDGGAPFRPMDGGGVRFAKAGAGELVSAAVDGKEVAARFRYGDRLVDYRFEPRGKSLVLDVWCEGGAATELSFGTVRDVRNPRLITVPYITLGKANPRVLISGTKQHRVFTSIWFDWYRSNASEPYFFEQPSVTADSAQINGGMRYVPKTDGVRNGLYERVFVTTSPIYEETLPTIPNPRSLRAREGSGVVWTVAQPEVFQTDYERCRRIRAYGLDKIMQHSHEVTWRDGYDSYTMRLKAAPQKGGDAALQWYIKAQTALGWLQGVYTNYCDFAPVNTNWSPDHVQRMPDGEWRRAWPRTYAMKPAKAVEMDAYYAPRIKEKFHPRMSYTDVHTDHPPPWEYCDYDARVPGAATFAATFYAYGQLLLNDQRVYGPTQSEGTFQWMFAGLQSGGYGWVYTDVNLLEQPVDVAFMLHKIHPLECDYGMGYFPYYVKQLDKNWKKSPKRRDYVDLFLATTIAYGNMGWLVKDWGLDDSFGVEVMTRSYYMMQQLQQQYAFSRPERIEYADRSGRFQTPSEAHASGVIATSRLHVLYENGTHVYVNRGREGSWEVSGPGGSSYTLPVSGWLVFNEGARFLEFSAAVDGHRVDYVSARDYEFLDGRGQWTEHGSLGAAGSVARRVLNDGAIELIDIYGNDRIALRTSTGGTLTAFGPEGEELGDVALRATRDGRRQFHPLPGGRRYVFHARD